MTAIWLYNGKKGTALMGTILEELDNHYRILVTSWESKRMSRFEGCQMLVRKEIVTIR